MRSCHGARACFKIIMLLPCRAAVPVRAKAADVLVRCLGGDASPVPEIANNREAQEALAKEQPDHPARLFVATVEEETRVTPPPPPQEIWHTPAPKGVGDYNSKHYVLGSLTYPDMCKTGGIRTRFEGRAASSARDSRSGAAAGL